MTGSSSRSKWTLSRQGHLWRGRFSAMGGPCEVLIDGLRRRDARAALKRTRAEARRIEARFSRYRPDSVVSRINASAGRVVEVDDECARLLDFADHLHSISNGSFDITSGVLRRVWSFDGGSRVPETQAVRELLELVGWEKVEWARPRIRLPEGMEIDFGGIGKEYAVDRVAEELARSYVGRFLVNFGGDLRVTAPQRDKSEWQVAIERPEHEGEGIQQIPMARGGLATSGDSRRFVLHEGRRYGHILDPRTGWPVAGAPRSITVQAETCVEAGMLSTLAVLQGARAASFLQEHGIRSWVVD